MQFHTLSFLELYASSTTDYFGQQAIYAHFPSGMTNNDRSRSSVTSQKSYLAAEALCHTGVQVPTEAGSVESWDLCKTF